MHANSLGSTKLSSLWILDYLWKQCFFFFAFLTSSFTLKSGRIPSWFLQFITGNNYCKSIVCFMCLTVRLQYVPQSLPAALHSEFITITVNVFAFAHWKKVRLIGPGKREPRLVWPQWASVEASLSPFLFPSQHGSFLQLHFAVWVLVLCCLGNICPRLDSVAHLDIMFTTTGSRGLCKYPGNCVKCQQSSRSPSPPLKRQLA